MLIGLLLVALISSLNIFSATFRPVDTSASQRIAERRKHARERRAAADSLRRQINADSVAALLPDSIFLGAPVTDADLVVDSLNATGANAVLTPVDTLGIAISPEAQYSIDSLAAMHGGEPAVRYREFNPDPTRAVWLSALFPGLGQIYNRRFWKLPIVVGAFMGLGYGTSWNNGMLRDYTHAYNDIMDNDPTTKSYMDFFPASTREEDLDKTWLANTLKHRKDFYRRNRDLCIICMVGVYLVAMVDAYVDASLAHFDISTDISMTVSPAVIPDGRSRLPGLGLQWAFNF